MQQEQSQEQSQEQWDFGSPEEIQEALERNKKLAESGFNIRAADENEPKPIIDKDILGDCKKEAPQYFI
jgi:hypothetical protein